MHRRQILLRFPEFLCEKACELNQFIVSSVTPDEIHGAIRTDTGVEQRNMEVPELNIDKVLVLVRRYLGAIFLALGRLEAKAFERRTLLRNPDRNTAKWVSL